MSKKSPYLFGQTQNLIFCANGQFDHSSPSSTNLTSRPLAHSREAKLYKSINKQIYKRNYIQYQFKEMTF